MLIINTHIITSLVVLTVGSPEIRITKCPFQCRWEHREYSYTKHTVIYNIKIFTSPTAPEWKMNWEEDHLSGGIQLILIYYRAFNCQNLWWAHTAGKWDWQQTVNRKPTIKSPATPYHHHEHNLIKFLARFKGNQIHCGNTTKWNCNTALLI